jgi:hypothetical protein
LGFDDADAEVGAVAASCVTEECVGARSLDVSPASLADASGYDSDSVSPQ